MAKTIEFELVDKETGKSHGTFSWPVTPMNKIKSASALQKQQKAKLEKLVKDQIKMAKNHFKDGAWDLDSTFLLHEVIDDFFGFSLTDLFITQMCDKVKVGYTHRGDKTVFRNVIPKVFYSQVRNRLYIDTKARDVDYDIQLGNL